MTDMLRSKELRFVEQVIGPCQLAHPVVGSPPVNRIVLIRNASGYEYIAKRHDNRDKFAQEIYAYRHWAPALGSHVPRLITHDPVTLTILLSALPGTNRHPMDDVATHRQAGRLLRLLHDAEALRPWAGFSKWMGSSVGKWRTHCQPMLSRKERLAVDRHLAALWAVDVPMGGPCHFDYQPRNWLIDTTGTLRLVDFEHARIGLQARDLVRLQFRFWKSDPSLPEAFFDGYGRCLTDSEQEILRHCGAIDAITALVHGRQTGNLSMMSTGRSTLRQIMEGT